MGAPFDITLYATDSAIAAEAVTRAFALVDSLVYIFSDYIDSSEVNRLCAVAGRPDHNFIASPPFFDLLQQSVKAWELSDHHFDITLGPLTRLWRKARKENRWPEDALVQEKLRLTGSDKILPDPATRRVQLAQKGMQLDFGGIAQGYIAGKVLEHLTAAGIRSALVNASGDIAVTAPPPGKAGWTIGINVPGSGDVLLDRRLEIVNKAVTTSGDVYQYMLHEGKKYSHVIDPTTGYGITDRRNVTVIADDCTTADWLTKACSLLSPRKAKKLARKLGAELLVTSVKDDKLHSFSTRGFHHYWKSP